MRTLSLKSKKTTFRFFVISSLFVFLLFVVPLSGFAQDANSIDALQQVGKAFTRIAKKASPAVVGFEAEKVVAMDPPSLREKPFGEPFEDDFFDFFFRRPYHRRRSPRQKPRRSVKGSGFIISADGYILTNNHLAENTEKITVKLTDGREFEAKIIGTDPDSDVAVIKIDANNLPTLEMADSDTLEVGEWVIAIGNPFGLSHTVTAGIVSAKGRTLGLAEYEDFIQTDAAINPGNSGGPLLNLDGKVVGINTAIVSRTGGYMGIGMAIPINMAKNIYSQLLGGGTVTRGALGVQITKLDADLADSLGLEENTRGVAIVEVFEGSAAQKAGMKRYDVVVELDGKKVEKANDLRNRIAMLKPGTKVKLIVLRDGKRKTLMVELSDTSVLKQAKLESSEIVEELGFAVQNLTDDLAARYGYEDQSGVIVSKVDPGSVAGRNGVSPGALIMEVNRQPINNVKEFNEAIKKARKEETVLLLIDSGPYRIMLALPLPKK